MSTVKTLHKLREAIWPLENSIVLALAAHTVKMEQKVLHSERRTKKIQGVFTCYFGDMHLDMLF